LARLIGGGTESQETCDESIYQTVECEPALLML
jgi:hypothetical protein